jgi:vacuolar protein sorting-associated protein 13D
MELTLSGSYFGQNEELRHDYLSCSCCQVITKINFIYRLPLMELQFENVKLGLESRPRSGSHKFQITLGAMFLHDHLTRDTAFPQLVGPHDQDCGSVVGHGGVSNRAYTSGLVRLLSQSSVSNRAQPEEPLFKLVYEYLPFNSSMDYR